MKHLFLQRQKPDRMSKKLLIALILLIFKLNLYSNNPEIASETITLKLKDNTLIEAFEKISELTDYSFAFSEESIPTDLKYTKDFNNTSVEKILNYLLKGTSLQYKFLDEQIIISKKKSTKKYTLSGFVKDKNTGENLFQATIFDKESLRGCATNNHGYYSLSLPEGIYTIVYSYIGNETIEKQLVLDKNIELTVQLESNLHLDEVVIIGREKTEIINKSDPIGKMNLTNEKMSAMPVVMGEPDLLKSMQLIPGIQGGSEANGAIYVRGGGPLQNLFLLDDVPIYNCFHLLGLFSVFNSDIVANTQVIKGGFPAQYGGRLSSVVDIKTKDGNMKEFKGKISLGLISSKLFLEGPLIKDKTSFSLAGRLGYYSIYGEFLPNEIGSGSDIKDYKFYDINLKLSHKLSENHKLYLSAYTGNDKGEDIDKKECDCTEINQYQFNQTTDGQKWNNIIGSLGWAGKISDKLFGNIQLSYSRYNYNGYLQDTSYSSSLTDTSYSYTGADLENEVSYYAGAANLEYHIIPELNLKMGYKYNIQNLDSDNSKITNNFIDQSTYQVKDSLLSKYEHNTSEHAGYLEMEFKPFKIFRITPGVHISHYTNEDYANTLIQPRVSSSLEFVENVILKASYSKMGQHIHLLGATRIKQASDLLVAAGEHAPSEESDQYSVGLSFLRFKNYKIHLDAYYKKLSNLINFSEGASYFTTSANWEDNIEIGTGESKGIELLLEKPFGKFTGWLGYTYSKTTRKFENINLGKEFPFIYDHTHYLSITGKYHFNKKYNIGFNWLYHSGSMFTIPSTFYYSYTDMYGRIGTSEKIFYNEKNAYRAPDYHRLDLSLNYLRVRKNRETKWSLSVYNVYNRRNVFVSNYDEGWAHILGNHGYTIRMINEKKLIGIIPSLSYTLSF